MRAVSLFCVGILLCTVSWAAAQGQERRTIRQSCIGDRCALYERGARIGSIQKRRYDFVIRDSRGNTTHKVRVNRGTIKVEETRRGR